MNIKIIIEYDGSNYHGWQCQKNALSIQEVLEKAISNITGEQIRVIGAGRTDAGVHALAQVANFITNTKIPPEKLPLAINSQLPKDIVVKDAKIMPEDFHSRFWAKGKVYTYKIYNALYPSPFLRKYSYFFPLPLDVNKMSEAAKYFIGVHDFSAFRATGSSVKSTIREIRNLNIFKNGDLINIQVEANGFLYNMMRIISGTLLQVGLNQIKPSDIASIIESKDRTQAGKTLPPNGLYLIKVMY